MPIYEYSCKKCGQTIEIIQKFSDAPLKKHAKCGGSLTKLISQSAFQLKGGGWYATDYVKTPQPSAEGGTKDSADSKESKDGKDTKKESKTEAAKDSSSTKTASPAPAASSSSSKSSDK